MPASPARRIEPERKAAERSSVVPISFDEVESAAVRAVYNAWDRWRGDRALPTRDEIALRDLGQYLGNISLARAFADGSDYEFRIIGDVHVQAYGMNMQGKRMSDAVAHSPRYGKLLKASYDMVRAMGKPYAFRGVIGRDAPDARFSWFETCYLPLGRAQSEVEFVINAAVYVPRDGIWV